MMNEKSEIKKKENQLYDKFKCNKNYEDWNKLRYSRCEEYKDVPSKITFPSAYVDTYCHTSYETVKNSTIIEQVRLISTRNDLKQN